MSPRTAKEIETAFREMGLTEESWGGRKVWGIETQVDGAPEQLVFIRITTTTTPLEDDENANLA